MHSVNMSEPRVKRIKTCLPLCRTHIFCWESGEAKLPDCCGGKSVWSFHFAYGGLLQTGSAGKNFTVKHDALYSTPNHQCSRIALICRIDLCLWSCMGKFSSPHHELLSSPTQPELTKDAHIKTLTLYRCFIKISLGK